MKRLLITALFALYHFVTYGQSLSVAPARAFFKGTENGELTQYVTLQNNGKQPILLKASLKDWKRDTLGTKIYYAPGTLTTSNAKWIRVDPELVEIMPGENKRVTVIMKPVEDVKKMVTNSMLFFTQLNEQTVQTKSKDGRNMGLKLKVEMGVHLYHVPNGLYEKNIDFLSFEDQGFVNRDTAAVVRRLKLKVENTGELVMDGEVRFELTNSVTGEEIKLPSVAISMLPDATQNVYLDLPGNIEKGTKLVAVAILDSGSEMNLKVAEKNFTY